MARGLLVSQAQDGLEWTRIGRYDSEFDFEAGDQTESCLCLILVSTGLVAFLSEGFGGKGTDLPGTA